MAVHRVTMQEIADACGLSRNTVSKIFNQRGSVPQATRQMVLDKARELGYMQLPAAEASPQVQPAAVHSTRTIVLLTSHMPVDYHFGIFFIPAFADQLSRVGYTLMMCEISAAELQSRTLPGHIAPDRIAGLMTIELFDQAYLNMLCGLGLPLLVVDGHCDSDLMPLQSDVISMENTSSMFRIVSHIIQAGARQIGFVGDIRHCCSFQERWRGYCVALEQAGLTVDRDCCILDRDSSFYGDPDWLNEKFRAMPGLPDAFVCANDFLALNIMTALKQQGVAIPDQVMVSGFDGMPQTGVVDPALTTAQIPNAEIARLAAELLLARIDNPDRPLQRVYVETKPILRKSTAPHPAK